MLTPLDIAQEAFAAAADKKAARPVIIDMRGHSDICDFQFICSGQSNKQAQAIAKEIEARCRRIGVRPSAIEGHQTGNWILLDFGPTIVHVFYNILRDYYAIEDLWPKAKHIEVKQTQSP